MFCEWDLGVYNPEISASPIVTKWVRRGGGFFFLCDIDSCILLVVLLLSFFYVKHEILELHWFLCFKDRLFTRAYSQFLL